MPSTVVNKHCGHGERVRGLASKTKLKSIDWPTITSKILNGAGTPRSVFVELKAVHSNLDIQTIRNYVNREMKKRLTDLVEWANKHFGGSDARGFTNNDFEILMAKHKSDKSMAVVGLLREGVGRAGHKDGQRVGRATIVVKFPGDDQKFYTMSESTLAECTGAKVCH